MKNGGTFTSEIHHSRQSSSPLPGTTEKSHNRDDEEMARLGKRQELRVGTDLMSSAWTAQD